MTKDYGRWLPPPTTTTTVPCEDDTTTTTAPESDDTTTTTSSPQDTTTTTYQGTTTTEQPNGTTSTTGGTTTTAGNTPTSVSAAPPTAPSPSVSVQGTVVTQPVALVVARTQPTPETLPLTGPGLVPLLLIVVLILCAMGSLASAVGRWLRLSAEKS